MTVQNDLSRVIDETVTPILGEEHRICIIDPPGYANVGDSAIFLGQLNFLKRNYPRAKITFFDSNSYSASADPQIEKASAIILQGGGNFGDLWPHHQAIRNRILDRFRHKKIIQMPQSISFRDESEQKATARLIAAQKDFTLLTRDRKTLQFAREVFQCRSVLCPDMAFAMEPITRKAATEDVFGLLRTDKEVAANHSEIIDFLATTGLGFKTADWLDDPRTITRSMDRKLTIVTKRLPSITEPIQSLMLRNRRRYAEQRVARGIELLSSGKIVVTDRLHAHIMSCLLGIPNLVFDSSDGKVSAFYDTWTGGKVVAKLLRSPSSLPEEIAALARGQCA